MSQQYEELRQAMISLLTTGTAPPEVLKRHDIAPDPFSHSPDLDAIKNRYLTPQPMRDADFHAMARGDVLGLVQETAKLRHFFETHLATRHGYLSPDELQRTEEALLLWLQCRLRKEA